LLGGGKAVELRLKGEPGALTETRYHSKSRILTYADSQLRRDRLETVDFLVQNRVVATDPASGVLRVQTTTVNKDGPVPLHDLAFPELLETIDYVFRPTGEVLMAGPFPPSSIFFVPSVPIAKEKVQVGDTWVLEHVWRSSRDGVPLKLEILAILKDLVKCEGKNTCADLEISGHVNLVVAPDAAKALFISKLWGRMLFSIERGDVIWSQTRSLEDVRHPGGRVLVNSCMTSEMRLGAEYRASRGCEPAEEAVSELPKI
jgi:hypothetical protein